MDKIDLSSIEVDEVMNEPENTIPIYNPTINIPNPIDNIPLNMQSSFDNIINSNINNKVINESINDTEKNDENNIDRRRIILILQLYVNEFPDKLKSFKSINFEKLSDDKLKSLKKEFDFIIGAKCNVKTAQYAITQGVNLLETACITFTPLKVQGLSSAVNDDEFQDDIKHLALKYMTFVKTEPEGRIAFKILSSILLLHQINTSKIGNISNINNSDEIEQINNKYSEL